MDRQIRVAALRNDGAGSEKIALPYLALYELWWPTLTFEVDKQGRVASYCSVGNAPNGMRFARVAVIENAICTRRR